LLAILDFLDHGLLNKNEIPLSPDLVKIFKRYFDVARQRDDQPTIENPFYHVSGDGFWQLVPKSGERPPYESGNASRVPTTKALREIYARFDENLWDALLTDVYKNLISFARHHAALIQMGVQALLQPFSQDRIACHMRPR
jgi:putative restriction endonuclease